MFCNYSSCVGESALCLAPQMRITVRHYNDLVDEAAALMESLANNHAFIDGNKRISFVLTDTFLRMKGFYLEVDAIAAHGFIIDSISRGEFRFHSIREWIAASLKPLTET